MLDLTQLMEQIRNLRFDVVVHLGAGGTPADAYRALVSRRLVLIDGSSSAVAELTSATAAQRPNVEVVEATIAAEGGPVIWYGHNLPWLDGLAEASSLKAIYPRLQVTSREQRTAIGLADLIQSLQIKSAGAEENALLVDLPGQEDQLLASNLGAALAPFNWVVLRHRSDASTPRPAIGQLASAGFDLLGEQLQEGGVEATSLFRRAAFRLERELRERLGAAERELAAACSDFELRIDEAQSFARTLERERDALLEEAASHRSEVSEMRRKLDVAMTDLEASNKQRQSLQVELQKLDAAMRAAQARAELQMAEQSRTAQAEVAQAHAGMKQIEHDLKEARAALADRDMRQHLLDAEILRAEAQLELVKDVLLREKNF